MRFGKLKIALVIAGAAGVAAAMLNGSGQDDEVQTKLQYMPDMADAPTVKAQEDYLNPPDGAVAVNAILYPATAEESETVLRNPFRPNPQDLEAGKELFATFCVPCHGATGKGNGTVIEKGFPNPPDITGPDYAKREDGYFFHKITFGGAMMSGYGHAISPQERWQIVLYLKSLQKGTP